MMPMVLCVSAHGVPVGVVGVTYPSAACRICGQAIYNLAANRHAQWWLCKHLITCHHMGGLMVDLEPLELMVRHGPPSPDDACVYEQGYESHPRPLGHLSSDPSAPAASCTRPGSTVGDSSNVLGNVRS